LRNEISADPGGTIEPNAPSSPSATPAYIPMSQTSEDLGQLWLAQTIKRDYGVTNVFADAWSAPGFMKDNNTQIGAGTLCGAPGVTCPSGDWRQAYANYLVQYAKDYAAAGVPLSYVGPVNEPTWNAVFYDGMLMTPAQLANFMDVLGPTLAKSRFQTRGTKAECCASIGWDAAQQDAAAIEADPVASHYTPLFTSHGYSAAPDSPLAGWNKQVWETEWTTFNGTFDPQWDGGNDSGMAWAQNIYNGLVNANLNAFLFWWGIGDSTIVANDCCLVAINGSTVSSSGRLWAFANYARYIRPGAIRIGATSPDSAVEISAYKNTNGTVAIVALNTAATAQPVTYSLSGTGTPDGATVTPYLSNDSNDTAAQPPIPVRQGSFSATIPARSLVTYVLRHGG
jgi:O-glycosyl hydrolase